MRGPLDVMMRCEFGDFVGGFAHHIDEPINIARLVMAESNNTIGFSSERHWNSKRVARKGSNGNPPMAAARNNLLVLLAPLRIREAIALLNNEIDRAQDARQVAHERVFHFVRRVRHAKKSLFALVPFKIFPQRIEPGGGKV